MYNSVVSGETPSRNGRIPATIIISERLLEGALPDEFNLRWIRVASSRPFRLPAFPHTPQRGLLPGEYRSCTFSQRGLRPLIWPKRPVAASMRGCTTCARSPPFPLERPSFYTSGFGPYSSLCPPSDDTSRVGSSPLGGCVWWSLRVLAPRRHRPAATCPRRRWRASSLGTASKFGHRTLKATGGQRACNEN